MADLKTFEELTLPDTDLFRVRGVGASYLKPQKTVGPDGQPTVVFVGALAGRGEIVELVKSEAERLGAVGAVVPAEAPKGYDELSRPELEILATSRGVTVRSTSADPDNPLDDDYRNALALFDIGSDAALVGVSSTPGGVVQSSESAVSPVLVDGVHAAPATDQEDGTETRAVEERAFAQRGHSMTAMFDARGKSASEVSDWIQSERPNAATTVAAANDDPEAARVVLEAEAAAHEGDPRATVARPLEQIADRGGQSGE
jgi:hypothetical protein